MTDTITVRLDATDADMNDPLAIARQLPDATALPPGTRVNVLATAFRDRSPKRLSAVLRRLLGPARVAVIRATRCTALLVRGYADIGADDEQAWGLACPSPNK